MSQSMSTEQNLDDGQAFPVLELQGAASSTLRKGRGALWAPTTAANVRVNNAGRAVLTRPQENHTKGRDTRNDGGEANDPRDDLRSPEKLFRSNDHRDDNHHERIHDSQSELNRHRRRAAETTDYTLFAAKLKTSFVFGA